MNAPRQSAASQFHAPRRGGFTLVELLAAMVSIAVLALVLLPALAGTKPDSQAFQCMNNQRQIVLTWHMYAADNNGALPGNDYYTGMGQNPPPYDATRPGAAPTWVGGAMDPTSSSTQPTNYIYLLSPQAALGPYNTNAATYHCPADQSTIQGKGPRVRSYSMNAAVGTVQYSAGIPQPRGSPVGGTWLGGSYQSGLNNTLWRTYGTLSSMTKPSPANLFVIADEHPDSINDPAFMIGMGVIPDVNGQPTLNTVIDAPAYYHDGGCTFAFADGHVQIHRWIGSGIKRPIVWSLSPSGYTHQNDFVLFGPDLQDLRWLQMHATAAK